MRKKVSGLILCFALLFSLPLPAFAANQVNTMDIQAVIYEDGSMYVTQVWEGDFNEGTESYIPMNVYRGLKSSVQIYFHFMKPCGYKAFQTLIS